MDREEEEVGRVVVVVGGGYPVKKKCMPESQLFFWERRDGKRDRNEGGWTFSEPSERNEI